jgi:hypothetical protein
MQKTRQGTQGFAMQQFVNHWLCKTDFFSAACLRLYEPEQRYRSKGKYCFTYRDFARNVNNNPPVSRYFYGLFYGHGLRIAQNAGKRKSAGAAAPPLIPLSAVEVKPHADCFAVFVIQFGVLDKA